MCCCGKPTINGERAYRWQPNDTPSVYPINPPTLQDEDKLLYDEPGRCGGLDSHSHHYRVVSNYGQLLVLVRHGGGDERFPLGLYKNQQEILANLDSDARYWLLNAFYRACSKAKRDATEKEAAKWRLAAAEKRIKTRKMPKRGTVKVWIESEQIVRSK